MATLIIDPELQALIPPLTEDEFKGLEADIIRDGVRNPIIVWAGHNVIVDGHNRYRICQEHNIPFAVFEKEFEDKAEVIDFMYEEQTHRRNLTPGQKSALEIDVSEAKEREAAKAKKSEAGQKNLERYISSSHQLVGTNEKPADATGLSVEPPAQMDENPPKQLTPAQKAFATVESKPISKPTKNRDNETARRLAERAGVGVGTMTRTMAVKHSGETDLYDKVRSGEMSANKAYTEMKRREQEASSVDETPGQAIVHNESGIGKTVICDLLVTEVPSSDDPEAFASKWLYGALSGVRHQGFAYVIVDSDPRTLAVYLNADLPLNVTLEQVLVWSFNYIIGNNDTTRYKPSWKAILFYRGVEAGNLSFTYLNERNAVHAINAEGGELGKREFELRVPMELAKRIVKHATREGDLVFDPFANNGTFLVAARELGRDAIGYEPDPGKVGSMGKHGVITEPDAT